MKDIYIIHGKGPCGKTWFINNIVYDENVDKYCWNTVTSMDFMQKGKSELCYYKNLIIDEFDDDYAEGILKTVLNYQDNFDNLFIICSVYNQIVKNNICRKISVASNGKVKIHVLNFDNGENFNIRKW